MLNFGASKPRVKGGPGPLAPHQPWIHTGPLRSTSRRYASYWNVFLFNLFSRCSRVIRVIHVIYHVNEDNDFVVDAFNVPDIRFVWEEVQFMCLVLLFHILQCITGFYGWLRLLTWVKVTDLTLTLYSLNGHNNLWDNISVIRWVENMTNSYLWCVFFRFIISLLVIYKYLFFILVHSHSR